MTPQVNPKQESEFARVKRIMEMEPPTDFDPGEAAPWTSDEWEEFARQEPLPPNQPFQLNAEELVEIYE